MPHDGSVDLSDQRNRQGAGGSQSIDDELLRLVADRMILESQSGDLEYRLDIRVSLAADNPVRVPFSRVIPITKISWAVASMSS